MDVFIAKHAAHARAANPALRHLSLRVRLTGRTDAYAAAEALAAELRALAMQLDEEIEANARPVLKVEELLFDPAKPVNPDGTTFQMPAERRIPQ